MHYLTAGGVKGRGGVRTSRGELESLRKALALSCIRRKECREQHWVRRTGINAKNTISLTDGS